jgi:hypothetical protein
MSERGIVQDGRSGPEIQDFLRAQGGATAGEAISSHQSGKQGKSYIAENHEHSLRSFPNETEHISWWRSIRNRKNGTRNLTTSTCGSMVRGGCERTSNRHCFVEWRGSLNFLFAEQLN